MFADFIFLSKPLSEISISLLKVKINSRAVGERRSIHRKREKGKKKIENFIPLQAFSARVIESYKARGIFSLRSRNRSKSLNSICQRNSADRTWAWRCSSWFVERSTWAKLLLCWIDCRTGLIRVSQAWGLPQLQKRTRGVGGGKLRSWISIKMEKFLAITVCDQRSLSCTTKNSSISLRFKLCNFTVERPQIELLLQILNGCRSVVCFALELLHETLAARLDQGLDPTVIL